MRKARAIEPFYSFRDPVSIVGTDPFIKVIEESKKEEPEGGEADDVEGEGEEGGNGTPAGRGFGTGVVGDDSGGQEAVVEVGMDHAFAGHDGGDVVGFVELGERSSIDLSIFLGLAAKGIGPFFHASAAFPQKDEARDDDEIAGDKFGPVATPPEGEGEEGKKQERGQQAQEAGGPVLAQMGHFMGENGFHFFCGKNGVEFLGDRDGVGKGQGEGVGLVPAKGPDGGGGSLPMGGEFLRELDKFRVAGNEQAHDSTESDPAAELNPKIGEDGGGKIERGLEAPLRGQIICHNGENEEHGEIDVDDDGNVEEVLGVRSGMLVITSRPMDNNPVRREEANRENEPKKEPLGNRHDEAGKITCRGGVDQGKQKDRSAEEDLEGIAAPGTLGPMQGGVGGHAATDAERDDSDGGQRKAGGRGEQDQDDEPSVGPLDQIVRERETWKPGEGVVADSGPVGAVAFVDRDAAVAGGVGPGEPLGGRLVAELGRSLPPEEGRRAVADIVIDTGDPSHGGG